MRRGETEYFSDDDAQIYSNVGLQVKATFTHDDFLGNPQTRAILEGDFQERLARRIERELSAFYEGLRKHEHDVASGMLAYDGGGEGVAMLLYIIANNIKKDYRFEMFYERPDLATPLLIEYEIAH
jgi:hypothetical protein